MLQNQRGTPRRAEGISAAAVTPAARFQPAANAKNGGKGKSPSRHRSQIHLSSRFRVKCSIPGRVHTAQSTALPICAATELLLCLPPARVLPEEPRPALEASDDGTGFPARPCPDVVRLVPIHRAARDLRPACGPCGSRAWSAVASTGPASAWRAKPAENAHWPFPDPPAPAPPYRSAPGSPLDPACRLSSVAAFPALTSSGSPRRSTSFNRCSCRIPSIALRWSSVSFSSATIRGLFQKCPPAPPNARSMGGRCSPNPGPMSPPGPMPPPPGPCALASPPAIRTPATAKTNRPAIVNLIVFSSACIPGDISFCLLPCLTYLVPSSSINCASGSIAAGTSRDTSLSTVASRSLSFVASFAAVGCSASRRACSAFCAAACFAAIRASS